VRTTTIRGALLVIAFANNALADDTPAPTGNFISSLKQSFHQDYDHEVVRGHFDVGTPPNSHRYYCLVDPKTGKPEANGVAGTLIPRRDGMTGVQGASVSFYSCSDAESKGLLVTSDYQVTMEKVSQQPKAPASPALASVTPASPAMAEPSLKLSTTDPMATLRSFIDAYNSGDSTALQSLLVESTEFAWVQPDGSTVWGRQAASEAVQASRSEGAQFQLQTDDRHTIALASKTAILIAKLRLTRTSQDPRVIRCSGVMVQTSNGWRIASLFMTPAI
jgi:hypothetical protein